MKKLGINIFLNKSKCYILVADLLQISMGAEIFYHSNKDVVSALISSFSVSGNAEEVICD